MQRTDRSPQWPPESTLEMKYIQQKDLIRSTRALHKRGGPYQRAADTVMMIIGRINSGETNPFHGVGKTAHGETRIRKCVKYDLARFCRLITVVDRECCYLLFVGSHDDCDNWLEQNRGFIPVVDDDGELCHVETSGTNLDAETRIRGESDLSDGKLYQKLSDDEFDSLTEGLPRSAVRKIEEVESINSEQEIIAIAGGIKNVDQSVVVHDVLIRLRHGNVKAAKRRLALYLGAFRSPAAEEKVSDGEDLRIIPDDSPDYQKVFAHFVRTADYYDWMTFMHGEQERVATGSYAGATKLVGVSGSGKTCIVVRRAVVLANRYPDDLVLVLTLNRPLAALISGLIQNVCEDQALEDRIEVMPFFALCQKLLGEFEPDNWKIYDDITWKSKEHIDEIWREYYRCELNNRDAACLQRVHDSLIARGIDAETYVRQEFDWIRSALPFEKREQYLEISREGRTYPINKEFRRLILEGLAGWERKMLDVGVTDYLGVASALHKHRHLLTPTYRCVLVDECQDFGTIELDIVNAISNEGDDNLLLCGDAAQQVSWKHQSLRDANIDIPRIRSMQIRTNYRNSRDILDFAFRVLDDNLTEEMLKWDDFDILDPDLANFGGPLPLQVSADGLSEEISYAMAYLEAELGESGKGCIAICGYSPYEVQVYGRSIEVRVLDGSTDISQGQLFLSDLSQTKGFEFDLVCVVNVTDGVIPNPKTPEAERYRDLSQLYVAMTRAKLQLVVSHSGPVSRYLSNIEGKVEGRWSEYVPRDVIGEFGEPRSLESVRTIDDPRPVGRMNGEQFLYSAHAIGLSSRLIEKIRVLVSGRDAGRRGNLRSWSTLSKAARDVRWESRARQLFGPETVKEFSDLTRRLGI